AAAASLGDSETAGETTDGTGSRSCGEGRSERSSDPQAASIVIKPAAVVTAHLDAEVMLPPQVLSVAVPASIVIDCLLWFTTSRRVPSGRKASGAQPAVDSH